jgi:hypothetical protein
MQAQKIQEKAKMSKCGKKVQGACFKCGKKGHLKANCLKNNDRKILKEIIMTITEVMMAKSTTNS